MSDEKITVSVDPDLEDLIPTFLENRATDVNKLKEALGASDFETLRSVGHSLKGVGGGYGFDKITELGASIESEAKENNIAALDNHIMELEQYLENVEVIFE